MCLGLKVFCGTQNFLGLKIWDIILKILGIPHRTFQCCFRCMIDPWHSFFPNF